MTWVAGAYKNPHIFKSDTFTTHFEKVWVPVCSWSVYIRARIIQELTPFPKRCEFLYVWLSYTCICIWGSMNHRAYSGNNWILNHYKLKRPFEPFEVMHGSAIKRIWGWKIIKFSNFQNNTPYSMLRFYLHLIVLFLSISGLNVRKCIFW